MDVFKNKVFHVWAKSKNLLDVTLMEAVQEMEKGLYEANLGGNVYKKRLAIPGRGKRGGSRTILAYKTSDKAFFIYGFSKNKQENITLKEEQALKKLAKIYLSYDRGQLDQAIKAGELFEVKL